MEKIIEYTTRGTCARAIRITLEDNVIKEVKFAGGCSGMNSLKTLIMIALPWAYLSANLKPWKKLVLVICSIPLAIISNAFRLISIFVLAEYVSPNFAKATWHDWSGLALFFPASMLGLFIIHSILNGEILFFRRRKTIIRTNNQ